ncbi:MULTISPECIES: putative phage abortive infection protein [unclassified Pseudomonas]|uniref:putative phage abortive infection protein n=1 Tax=unclassified Pseudomonas TaxID=196821 RepID=UPI00117B1A7C|nr:MULTISPECIES: putative phage abortive infection protein [unclassified Pseudomonas]
MKKFSNFFYKEDFDSPSSPPNLHMRNVALVCFGVILVSVLSYALVLILKTWPIEEYSIAKAGTFGDSFGALNSLFTGLGFAGLLVTIFLQREDIKLTRMELSETRTEIKLQSRTFQQQQFEESFYRLLTLYKENLSHLSIRSEAAVGERIYGIDALSVLQQKFDEACAAHRMLIFPFNPEGDDQEDYIYLLYKISSAIFFRQTRYTETLNTILSLVEDDCFSPERQEHYLNILSSQFTIYEVKYLFYQAFLNPNYKRLRSIISKSPSFRERFSSSSIPPSHFKSFELLWEVRLVQKEFNSDRLFSSDRFRAARKRAAQRRQKKTGR